MRSALLLIALCCVLTAVAAHSTLLKRAPSSSSSLLDESSVEDERAFGAWKAAHGKRYKSLAEEQVRFQTFKNNVALVHRLNENKSGGDDVVFSIDTPYADMSPDEFRAKVLMPSREPSVFPRERYAPVLPTFMAPPDSFDWRDHGAVSAVRDQSACGTCYAFSAAQAIEGQYFLAGNPLTQMSVQQVVECDSNDCGVFGGWPYLVFEYIIKIGGLMSEADYPYCCDGCFPCMPDHYNKTMCGPGPSFCNATQWHCLATSESKFTAHIRSWEAIDKDETTIASTLVARGPLSVALNAEMLQFYHSGVWHPPFCDPTSLDHAVLLVGYGVDKGALGEEKPYWLIKNSWGKKWGMDGYFKIRRGTGECGINTQVAIPVV